MSIIYRNFFIEALLGNEITEDEISASEQVKLMCVFLCTKSLEQSESEKEEEARREKDAENTTITRFQYSALQHRKN